MGFFTEFYAWLTRVLTTYIGDNTLRIAAVLEPAIVTLAILYVAIWGYLHLAGKIDEPFIAGVKRLLVLGVILGVSLSLWLYNEVIVDTFFNAPTQLAAVVVGGHDAVSTIDQIMLLGGDAAYSLIRQGGILEGNFSFYLAGFAVLLIVGITAIYTIFLLTLSKIALSVLLVLGPLFIAFLFFESTKRFFESWIAQMANYGFICILTVLVAGLMLSVLADAAEEAASAGGGILIVDAVRLCLAAGLTFLVMRQVMPMAAGLASGLALSSFGVVSAALAWGLGRATRGGGQFLRGMTDRETTRWDSMSRKSGYYARRALGAGVGRVARGWRENTIRTR
ncbi:type IV secretion system protein [Steroidobacter agaridevorans]|uniref:type IV secretion system protein n=1 Tax=Steroidobacter agaridevorans TaxID=2695856 RepID=UPI001325EF3D|nr:type IV secretion system protein [Steroidobacter agaridevorans]GFE87293.1 trwi protein [Steroidobacter agaridevorans]